MDAVEVVYRLHLSLAYQTRQEHMADLHANTMCIVELAPVNLHNARMYGLLAAVPVTQKYQVRTFLCMRLWSNDLLSHLRRLG